MQCKCGGVMTDKFQTKTVRGIIVAFLAIPTCSCGRVGGISEYLRSKKTMEFERKRSGPPGLMWHNWGSNR